MCSSLLGLPDKEYLENKDHEYNAKLRRCKSAKMTGHSCTCSTEEPGQCITSRVRARGLRTLWGSLSLPPHHCGSATMVFQSSISVFVESDNLRLQTVSDKIRPDVRTRSSILQLSVTKSWTQLMQLSMVNN